MKADNVVPLITELLNFILLNTFFQLSGCDGFVTQI